MHIWSFFIILILQTLFHSHPGHAEPYTYVFQNGNKVIFQPKPTSYEISFQKAGVPLALMDFLYTAPKMTLRIPREFSNAPPLSPKSNTSTPPITPLLPFNPEWIWLETVDEHNRPQRFYILDDGTWVTSSLAAWDQSNIKVIHTHEGRFLIENTKTVIQNQTLAQTSILKIDSSDPTPPIYLDMQWHNLDATPITYHPETKLISILGIPSLISTDTWCQHWDIFLNSNLDSNPEFTRQLTPDTLEVDFTNSPTPSIQNPEAIYTPLSPLFLEKAEPDFILKSCHSYQHSSRPGTWIIRSSDKKSINLSPQGLKEIENKLIQRQTAYLLSSAFWSHFAISDGILEIPELQRRVDLQHFDTELTQRNIRKQNRSVIEYQPIKRTRIQNDETQLDEPDDENLTFLSHPPQYPDLVEEARQFPARFHEVLDQTLKQKIVMALQQGSMILVGHSGIGKTSAIRAFANAIAHGEIKELPRSLEIRQVSLESLNLQNLNTTLTQYAKNRNVIYFLDSIDSLYKEPENKQWIQNILGAGVLKILGTAANSLKNPTDLNLFEKWTEIQFHHPENGFVHRMLQAILKKNQYTQDPTILQDIIEESTSRSAIQVQPKAALALLGQCIKNCPTPPFTAEHLEKAAQELYGPSSFEMSQVGSIQKRIKTLKEDLNQITGHVKAKNAIISAWTSLLLNINQKSAENILLVGPAVTSAADLAQRAAALTGIGTTFIDMDQFHEHFHTQDFEKIIYESLVRNSQQLFLLQNFNKAHFLVQETALKIIQEGQLIFQEIGAQKNLKTHPVTALKSIFILTAHSASEWIQNKTKLKQPLTEDELKNAILEEKQISRRHLTAIQTIVPMAGLSYNEFKNEFERRITHLLTSAEHIGQIRVTLDRPAEFINESLNRVSQHLDDSTLTRLMKHLSDLLIHSLQNPISDSIVIYWSNEDLPQFSVDRNDGYL